MSQVGPVTGRVRRVAPPQGEHKASPLLWTDSEGGVGMVARVYYEWFA
jgi:hypothetical protein